MRKSNSIDLIFIFVKTFRIIQDLNFSLMVSTISTLFVLLTAIQQVLAFIEIQLFHWSFIVLQLAGLISGLTGAEQCNGSFGKWKELGGESPIWPSVSSHFFNQISLPVKTRVWLIKAGLTYLGKWKIQQNHRCQKKLYVIIWSRKHKVTEKLKERRALQIKS